MVDANTIRSVSIFDGLTMHELRQMSSICNLLNLQKGDKIFSRGDDAKDFYIVRSGKVNLSFQISILLGLQPIVVDVMEPGDVFGWSALVGSHKLTLSADCDEDCELIQIPGKGVLSMCAEKHHLGYILMANLAKVIGNRMDRMQSLFQRELELNVPSL